jgi:hypothetical protein
MAFRCWATLIVAMFALGLTASDAHSQSVSPDELVFWQAVEQSGRPAEYQAYLNAFPNGRFAPLARIRAAGPASVAGPAPAAPQEAAPVAVASPHVWVRPVLPRVKLVSGIMLDTDATALRNGSNQRLAVMPVGAPDAITDQNLFLAESTPIAPARLHLTIPSGPPGQDEIRLYFIDRFATTYSVAARTPITVEPGVAGATLARDLVREAERLGPVRFEAAHRDRPMLVQAAFLRIRPQTEWNILWFGGAPIQEVGRRIVIISIGLPGAAPDDHGSLGEIVCALPASDTQTLDRVAGLQLGDPILVRGVPTSWSNASAADPVLLNRCTLS